jgi:hypothetical protein
MTAKMTCPNCGGTNVEAEFVDIGVGSQQATPYGCLDCHWVEGRIEFECPHGNKVGECNDCDVAGDFAYDANRENR